MPRQQLRDVDDAIRRNHHPHYLTTELSLVRILVPIRYHALSSSPRQVPFNVLVPICVVFCVFSEVSPVFCDLNINPLVIDYYATVSPHLLRVL